MKVIKLPVGSDPFVVDVENSLAAMQALVGGNIERCRFNPAGLFMYFNEDGFEKKLEPNVIVENNLIVGDIFFSRDDHGGAARDVTDADINEVFKTFNRMKGARL